MTEAQVGQAAPAAQATAMEATAMLVEDIDFPIIGATKSAMLQADPLESMPDPEEATQGIATHIKRFWPPRMRTQILQYIDAQHGTGLKSNVLAAINMHRGDLEPQGQTTSTCRITTRR